MENMGRMETKETKEMMDFMARRVTRYSGKQSDF